MVNCWGSSRGCAPKVRKLNDIMAKLAELLRQADQAFRGQRFCEAYADDPWRPHLHARSMVGLASLKVRSICLNELSKSEGSIDPIASSSAARSSCALSRYSTGPL